MYLYAYFKILNFKVQVWFYTWVNTWDFVKKLLFRKKIFSITSLLQQVAKEFPRSKLFYTTEILSSNTRQLEVIYKGSWNERNENQTKQPLRYFFILYKYLFAQLKSIQAKIFNGLKSTAVVINILKLISCLCLAFFLLIMQWDRQLYKYLIIPSSHKFHRQCLCTAISNMNLTITRGKKIEHVALIRSPGS